MTVSSRCVAADLFGVVADRSRPTDQIALQLIAPFSGQQKALRFGLDALSENRHIEAMPERNHGVDNCLGVMVVFQIANEALVDLDLVEWERV